MATKDKIVNLEDLKVVGDVVTDLRGAFDSCVDQTMTVTHSANIAGSDNLMNLTINSAGAVSFDTTAIGMKIPVENGKRYGLFRLNSSSVVIAFKPRISICDSSDTLLTFVNQTDNDITISDATANHMYISSGISEADWQKVMVIENYAGTAPSAYVPKETYYALDGIPTKTSDLTNDSGFITSANVQSRNILNWATATHHSIDGSGTVIANENGRTITMNVLPNTRYGLFRNNSSGVQAAWTPRVSIFDANGSLLQFYNSNNSDFTTPATATTMSVFQNGFLPEEAYLDYNAKVIENYSGTATLYKYSPYYNYKQSVAIGQSFWTGKTAVIYGDSITAQGNTNNATGYFYNAEKTLGFKSVLYRGVGGQTFKINPYTFYANADGSYNSRGGSEPPAGTTEHLGYFASWDRITAMIPETIRNTIDLVVICGGTNDFASVEEVDASGDNTAIVPAWVTNNDQDEEWAASDYYIGGDYNLSTLAGAIASTILKFGVWCPNARVVLATPFPRYDVETNAQMVVDNVTFRQFCGVEIAVAQYMSAPVIDANAECSITLANYADCTQSDHVHPVEMGRRMFGYPFVGGLTKIHPMNMFDLQE